MRYTPIAAVARKLGVTPKALRDTFDSGRVDQGLIKRRGRWKITDAAAVMRAFRENRNDAQDRQAPEGKPSSLTVAEIRLKEARTRRVEQDMAARAGLTLARADVRRAEYEAGKTIRENLENIPDRLCGQMAVETDPAVCRAIMAAEIRRALAQLADTLDAKAAP